MRSSPSPHHFPTSSWAHARARQQIRPIESFRVPQKLWTQDLLVAPASFGGQRRDPHWRPYLRKAPPAHSSRTFIFPKLYTASAEALRWAELKEETKKRRGLRVSFCSPAGNLQLRGLGTRPVPRSSHRRAISEWKRLHGQHRHRIHF